MEVARILGWIFEFGTDEFGENIYDLVQQMIIDGKDHYPDESLMGYFADTSVLGDSINIDVLECMGIANDLFIGRRSSEHMYNAFIENTPYDPSMKWPCHPNYDSLCPSFDRALCPYLQGQDPPRSQAVIWVPLPILRFAFFAKEVAVFGRPFEGMQKVAQEQLEELDGHFIHPEYFYILARVLELEDSAESRKALDILANNLFLGEKPLTQAWTQELEDAPWLR
ncbi:hypothetical protein K737_301041 [Holospora undulata HU1]|uniref:Uncharacterized protein n=1 Tax=Holospora undulata HU1 TaxID=1321371 RepID=A0A061JFS0_9PROT|nr:hypothetical protein K737_301041 [Holospora undulata HU1]